MQINTGPSDREPIVWDLNNLPNDVDLIDGGAIVAYLATAFKMGEASFGNGLVDAVAMSGGINEDGKVDMKLLDAAEALAEYLKGHQGEPFLLIDKSIRKSSDCTNYGGIVAQLSEVEELVGVHKLDEVRWLQAGLAVSSASAIHVRDFWDSKSSFGVEIYSRPHIGANGVLPLVGAECKLGSPFYFTGSPIVTDTQEAVVGTDIVPWILDNFDANEGYVFYRRVVSSLLPGAEQGTTPDLSTLLAEPFQTMASSELENLLQIGTILDEFAATQVELEKIRDEAISCVNQFLAGTMDRYDGFQQIIPRTNGSDGIVVTAPMDNVFGQQLESRHRAINGAVGSLRALLEQHQPVVED